MSDIPRYRPVANDKYGITDDVDGKLCEYRDYARLKAEVERLTKQVERLIVSLHKSHDEHAEALYKLKYKNERQTPRKKRSS
jgi:hypothetical protein